MNAEQLVDLLAASPEDPCVSIYQRTHRRFPEMRQDPVRFRRLVAEAEAELRRRHPGQSHDATLGTLHALQEDPAFWRHGTDGLGVFAAGDTLHVLRLQRPVADASVVGDGFHLRPLLRLGSGSGRYQVLCLTRRHIRLLEGDRDAIAEVALAPGVPAGIEDSLAALAGVRPEPDAGGPGPAAAASGGGQRGRTRTGTADHRHGSTTDAIAPDVAHFFRTVDRTVLAHHSRPTGLPLVLAGLPENLGPFRAQSRNPHLLPQAIELDPSSLDDAGIRERAWALLDAHEAARIDALLERHGAALGTGLGLERLDEADGAAAEGRIDTLLLEAPAAPADGASGEGTRASAAADDALDALAERVLRTGGTLVVVPPGRLGAPDRIAAILRF